MTSEWGDVAESFRAAARARTEAEAAVACASDAACLSINGEDCDGEGD